MKTRFLLFVVLILVIANPFAAVFAENPASPDLKVHFIDVGQGDAIFLELPSKQVALIDGGTRRAGETVIEYLSNLGVTKIDHLIATHPHEDHIGGLIAVVEEFAIGKIYMPRASHTTLTYESLLLAIRDKGLRITAVQSGIEADMGPEVRAVFVAPTSDSYSNLNNFSAVLRLNYGATNFLFTGDSEALSEREMIKGEESIQADVLKIGHHGSNTSSSQEFLETVEPKMAIISLGKDNLYGHPHDNVLVRLLDLGIDIYRTDRHETIVVTSDGNQLDVSVEKEEPTSKPKISSEVYRYIGNKNTKKFHLLSCTGLPMEHNRIHFQTREEAIQAGQEPCQICKP